jgi:mitochondrial import inner membrane translocase subunit TIM21
MIKRPDQAEFEYKFLALDVKGHPRIYLENTDEAAKASKKSVGKLFGIQWR